MVMTKNFSVIRDFHNVLAFTAFMSDCPIHSIVTLEVVVVVVAVAEGGERGSSICLVRLV